MKIHLKAVSLTLAIGLCMNVQTAFAAPEKEVAQAPGVEDRREQLLNTLENLEATAAGINLSEVLGGQIDYARNRVITAGTDELLAIPPNVMNNLRILELTSGQTRLMYDPELNMPREKGSASIEKATPGPVIQSMGPDYDDTDLSDPNYPNIAWSFGFGDPGEPDDDDNEGGGSGDGAGFCEHPGYSVNTRFILLNVAIASEAIKDIAEQGCDLTVAGFNLALACVVTDIAAYVNIGLNENQELCNDFMTAAEVTATWDGMKTVHGNVQHVHDDVAEVDSDLATHDSTVKAQLNTHDSDIKTQVAQHDSDLKAQLAQHDADIKARLGELQGTVDENQRLIKISMARQAELMRLMVTPQGNRVINPVVLSCTGDDCPDISEIMSCKNGAAWPCK